MIDEITLLFSHAAQQLIQTCAVVKLIKKTNKEIDVSGGVNEVSTRALVFWSPNLNGECLSKDLGQFVLGRSCSRCIPLIVINYVRSLVELASSTSMTFE